MADHFEKIKLKVEGMTCAGCASTIEKYLVKKEKDDVRVSFIDGTVAYNEPLADDLTNVIKGIQSLGYQVIMDDLPRAKKKWNIEQQLLVSAIFTFPLLFVHLFPSSFSWLHHPGVQFLLALPPLIIGFIQFLPGAYHSVRSRMPNMDVTICLGAIAALIYSLIGWAIDNSDMIFFETAASILTLVLLGHYLEHKAVKLTTRSIDALKNLAVEYGKMQMPSGVIVKIPLQDINPGDFLIVAEGDGVPVDGEIMSGEGFIDEALISGESAPIAKKKGDLLIGASQVLSGNFTIKVMHTGKDSILGKIITLVKASAAQKAPIQNTADRISSIFVPTVLVLALLTFCINYFFIKVGASQSMLRSIAVLVISCPCAMGLATPTAIMVGLGKAMREGILIKGAATLELLGRLQHIILDKTGTLTEPAVQINFIKKNEDQEIINAIYAMESRSSHPISKALLSFIDQYFKPVSVPMTVQEQKGKGLIGIDSKGAGWSILWSAKSNAIEVMHKEEVVAQILIEDHLKKGAEAFANNLFISSIQPVILSGDEPSKVQAVACTLKITDWKARLLPEQKAAEINKIKISGITAMVGDGINDAPALSLADIGISFSHASNAAIQSSQVVLLNGNLETLSKAIKVGKMTLKTIRQNLFWAFSYNIIAIPLAAFGYLNPMWSVLFMAFSDLVVIGNSLLLRGIRI